MDKGWVNNMNIYFNGWMVHNGEIVQALLCGGKERLKDGILILLVKIV